jgi:FkbM family methyltransferase
VRHTEGSGPVVASDPGGATLAKRMVQRLPPWRGRDRDRQLLELSERLDQTYEQLESLRAALERTSNEAHSSTVREGLDAPVLNPTSGALVISRYLPALERVRRRLATPLDAIVAGVDTDVGRVILPSFDQFILPALLASGSWEPEEGRLIRAHLNPGMTALNVGAQVGYTAMTMANAVGEHGLVVAIEPEPLNFQLLWENLRRNAVHNVLPINAAAGDRTGATTLAYSPDNSGDHRTAPHPVAVAQVEVPMIAVDDLLPYLLVDLVVIDAQGSDHRIVSGMTNLVDRCHPPMLVEFWPAGIMELGDNPAEIIDFYRGLGYQLSVVSTGDDVSDWDAATIVALALEDRDHVTLALR